MNTSHSASNSSVIHQYADSTTITIFWVVDVIIVLAILAANFSSIAVILRTSVCREKYGILLVSFSIADVIYGCHLLIIQATYWPIPLTAVCGGDWIRKSLPGGVMEGWISWHTVMLTLERYIAICYPLRYPQIITKKTLIAMAVTAWLCPIIEYCVPFIFIGVFACPVGISERLK